MPTCPITADIQALTQPVKCPTKAEYKTLAFLDALHKDAEKALEYMPAPRIGKYGNSKIHAAGAKALTLVYAGLAWHDCNPTPGCDSCYAMRFRYLHSAAHRRGTAWLYSYMARHRVRQLETIIQAEINEGKARAAMRGIPLAVRIHEAGDFINSAHVDMWYRLASDNADVIFWGYTRSDLAGMAEHIQRLARLPNAHIRASFDPAPDMLEFQMTRNNLPGAIIVGKTHRGKKHGPAKVTGAVNCPEQATNGEIGCADCGLCWHSSRPNIRFWAH